MGIDMKKVIVSCVLLLFCRQAAVSQVADPPASKDLRLAALCLIT